MYTHHTLSQGDKVMDHWGYNLKQHKLFTLQYLLYITLKNKNWIENELKNPQQRQVIFWKKNTITGHQTQSPLPSTTMASSSGNKFFDQTASSLGSTMECRFPSSDIPLSDPLWKGKELSKIKLFSSIVILPLCCLSNVVNILYPEIRSKVWFPVVSHRTGWAYNLHRLLWPTLHLLWPYEAI